MGYLSRGYYTVCLSPLFSVFVFFFAGTLVGTKHGWLLPIIVRTGVHALVIGIQVCGIILYLVGYVTEKREARAPIPFTLSFSIPLILWGLLVSFVAIGFYYSELIPWSKLPGVRELTIWDHLEYATWTLKGLLWIVSGLLFIVTSYMWERNWWVRAVKILRGRIKLYEGFWVWGIKF